MKKFHKYLIAALLSVSAVGACATDTEALKALKWQVGPVSGVLEGKSTLVVPKGASFLDEKEGSKYLQIIGNLPSNDAILDKDDWYASFSFNDSGYIKDDEKIDADALLASLKATDKSENAARRKRGFPELFTEGWYIPPHYDTATKRLEWALKLRSSDSTEPFVNYTVRLLGRRGYQSATLATGLETLDADVIAFKKILIGFSFNANEGYSEFKAGDHVAEFGLAALVAGGAAAAIAKTGLWKVILGFLAAGWKFIAAGAAALFWGVAKLFGKKKGS